MAKPWERGYAIDDAAPITAETAAPAASAAPAKKKGFFDTMFARGTPEWMQSTTAKSKAGWADQNQDYTEFDPTNPFTYLSESQKEEQSKAGKALAKGVRAATRVGAGVAQGAVIDPAMAVAQLVGGRDIANDAFNSYDTFRKNMGGEGFDAARLVGNVVSPVNRLAGVGASKLASSWGTGRLASSPFATGAAQGMTAALAMPVLGDSGGALDEDQSILGGKLAQVGTGALLGGGFNQLLTPIGNKLSGLSNQLTTGKLTPQQAAQLRNQQLQDVDINQLSQREALDLYKKMNPDAYLTWGQRGGDLANTIEQKLSSVPFIGDAIKTAQKKAQSDWNASQIRSVADEAGITLDKTSGRKAFNELSKKLSTKYDDMLEGTTLSDPVSLRAKVIGTIDDQGNYQKGAISDAFNELDPASQKKVEKLLEDKVFKKFGVDPEGNNSVRMTGKQFKNAEESLKEKIDELKMGNGEERTMARVLRGTLDEMFDQLQDKSGKAIGQPLKDLNRAYAKYKTLETASTARSGSKGAFSADQVVKASSKGAGRSNVARGRNDLANQAELAQNVWGDLVPDSGTAGRLMLAGAGIGGGSLFGLDPATTAGVGAGLYGLTRGAYSPAVMNAITKGYTGLGQKFDASKMGRLLGPRANEISRGLGTVGASDVQFFPEEEEKKKASGGMVLAPKKWQNWVEKKRRGGMVSMRDAYWGSGYNSYNEDELEEAIRDFNNSYGYAKGGEVGALNLTRGVDISPEEEVSLAERANRRLLEREMDALAAKEGMSPRMAMMSREQRMPRGEGGLREEIVSPFVKGSSTPDSYSWNQDALNAANTALNAGYNPDLINALVRNPGQQQQLVNDPRVLGALSGASDSRPTALDFQQLNNLGIRGAPQIDLSSRLDPATVERLTTESNHSDPAVRERAQADLNQMMQDVQDRYRNDPSNYTDASFTDAALNLVNKQAGQTTPDKPEVRKKVPLPKPKNSRLGWQADIPLYRDERNEVRFSGRGNTGKKDTSGMVTYTRQFADGGLIRALKA